jgi:hypothetical protein
MVSQLANRLCQLPGGWAGDGSTRQLTQPVRLAEFGRAARRNIPTLTRRVDRWAAIREQKTPVLDYCV